MVELSCHDADRRIELRRPDAHATEMVQRADDSNEAVPAHAEVRAVVEEDDAAERPFIHRGREQRTDDG